jgi:anti-anti-sigma factor
MAANLLNQVAALKLKERLDAQSAAWLHRQIEQLKQDGHGIWVFDMTHVEFLDSHGLVSLVAAHRAATEVNAQLVLCSVSQHVQIILDLTQLDQVFAIVETMEVLPVSIAHCINSEVQRSRKAA